jgi:hypothetical protein
MKRKMRGRGRDVGFIYFDIYLFFYGRYIPKTIKLTIILSKHEEGKAYEVHYIVLYITAGLSIRTQK